MERSPGPDSDDSAGNRAEPESRCSPYARCSAPGYAPDQIAYHVRLLHEAGYLDAMDLTTHSGFVWQPKTLTWQGHEFLDAARNTSVWQQVKTRLKDRGLDAPLSVIQQLAVRLTASMLLEG